MKGNPTSSAPRRAAARALSSRSALGWKTTDEDEIARRIERAASERMTITNLEPEEPFFGTFAVVSAGSGMPYRVEIRSLMARQNFCTCPDFRTNGLGTCKHIEAVLLRLREKPRLFERAAARGSGRVEIFLRREGEPEVRVEIPPAAPPAVKRLAGRFFDPAGRLRGSPQDAVPALERAVTALPEASRHRIRLASEVRQWVEERRRGSEREALRRAFEADLRHGRRSVDVLRQPLYDYQREGMLHLAFGERAMLADDMGLGKTVQAVAACALLKELRGIRRALVVSPASLKTEWEEQIRKFTDLPLAIVQGPRHQRRRMYRGGAFFFLANYEQILRDVLDINEILSPDVIILDEAQRIKNWSTKTAQAVKRLRSPYAFVLTGTPLENRIDEVYSITEFLNPHIFGPLFRFNREFYDLDERGRPRGYRNLDELRRRVRLIMLRRRKDEVEDQLPQRVDNNFFVEMSAAQRGPYQEYEQRVALLAAKARKRPLSPEEHEKLQRWLACMRMLCDTTYILDPGSRVSPKIEELEKIFEDVGVKNGRKALVFSEWERMLQLARDLAREMGLGYAWHTGDVPQHKRRAEINRFKNDPDCKLFFSTDCGGLGLNLQAASVVINLDLPWNPARLEQRIARAWRKHQPAAVHVVNLVTSDSIEHRMLGTLAVKRELADGVLDGRGDLGALKMPSGRESFLKRLQLLMGEGARSSLIDEPSARAVPVRGEEIAPPERFRQDVLAELSGRVQLIESRPLPGGEGEAVLVVVDGRPEQLEGVVRRLHHQAFGAKGRVEVLDRGTYETIQRLAALGLVSLPAGAGTELHRTGALGPPGPSPEEKRRLRASKALAEAEKKLAMGKLLASGGFAPEALSPVHQAVEQSLQALLFLAGSDADGADVEPVPAARIHGELVARGLLDAAEAAQVSALRELLAGRADEPTARRLVESGGRIFERAAQALARAGLGR